MWGRSDLFTDLTIAAEMLADVASREMACAYAAKAVMHSVMTADLDLVARCRSPVTKYSIVMFSSGISSLARSKLIDFTRPWEARDKAWVLLVLLAGLVAALLTRFAAERSF